MKIYEIDKEYIIYLHSFDSKVEKSTAEHYKFSRKYLGIVLRVNNFKYFAPLSSTKSHKDFFPDGKIRPSVIPLIRIIHINKDGSLSLLGKIQLNNMIPITDDNIIKIYDLNKEKDIKYKNMVFNQIEFINKNEKLIIRNANILYNNKIKNLDIGYVKNSVDFKLLEEKALEYAEKLKKKINEESKNIEKSEIDENESSNIEVNGNETEKIEIQENKEEIPNEEKDKNNIEQFSDEKQNSKEDKKVTIEKNNGISKEKAEIKEEKTKPEKEKPKREKRSRIRSRSNER